MKYNYKKIFSILQNRGDHTITDLAKIHNINITTLYVLDRFKNYEDYLEKTIAERDKKICSLVGTMANYDKKIRREIVFKDLKSQINELSKENFRLKKLFINN